MTKRLISLLLVVVTLLSICISTVSCAQLEAFVGEENLGEDYMNKYYPDRNQGGSDEDVIIEVPNEHDPDVVREEGCNLLTFFWSNKTWTKDEETLAKCDIWCWWDGADGKGYLLKKCPYGAMLTLNIPKEVKEVGFIVRKDCTDPGGTSWGYAVKDCGEDDLFATIEGPDTFIYLKSGKSDQYHSIDGGKHLTVIEKFNLAGMIEKNQIEYIITPATKFTDMSQIKVYEGDREIKINSVSSLNKNSTTGVITVNEELDITKTYTVKLDGFEDTCNVVPTGIFDTDWFADTYHYDGELGAILDTKNTEDTTDDVTTFKLWAPTASKVVLNLFESGHEGEAYSEIEMVRGEKGVWTHEEACGHGTYYTYSVTTSVGTQEAVDPYARSAGLNGNRGMVVDLDSTDPDGWDEDQSFNTGIDNYSDAIVWEVHVRDFSNMITDENLPENYRGKYLAFTKEGLVNENGIPIGIDYLKELGVNFVHLLPVYDYATVKEEDPDSGFNWGYDPKNYNVPEGSYSTDPKNGEVRINEFKQMVMGLHAAGIGVVMDVVYNHTYDKNASFNKIVPYYYYRYKANGANSSGSGCGNDTASERYMYGKFMVDSTSYWMEEYNLDGFRFDLMGLHDVDTMQEVEAAVHEINPQAILYGEGWTMMQNSYDPSLKAATQKYIHMIQPTGDAIGSVAVFNDIIRTGLKGESDDKSKGYINGDASNWKRDRVLFGVNGGVGAGAGADWKSDTAMVVNYMSAHDNSTLWDKLTVANGSSSKTARLAMNRLGATILFVSKGIVFFQAGEEMLRTKPNPKYEYGYDHNSYKSSDEINNLKWDTLSAESDEYKMMQYYAGLAAIRRTYGIFTDTDGVSFKTYDHGTNNSGFNIIINDGKGGTAVVVVNPDQNNSIKFSLPEGTFYQLCDGTNAGADPVNNNTFSGSIEVGRCSAYIFVNKQILDNARDY